MASTIDHDLLSASEPVNDLIDLAASALLAIGSRIRQLRGERRRIRRGRRDQVEAGDVGRGRHAGPARRRRA